MKKITSATGSQIRFRLRGDAAFVFDPSEAVEVSDTDAALLVERLGSQLAVEDIILNEKPSMEEEKVVTEVAEEKPEVSQETETVQETTVEEKPEVAETVEVA
jgi:hypothetical protein